MSREPALVEADGVAGQAARVVNAGRDVRVLGSGREARQRSERVAHDGDVVEIDLAGEVAALLRVLREEPVDRRVLRFDLGQAIGAARLVGHDEEAVRGEVLEERRVERDRAAVAAGPDHGRMLALAAHGVRDEQRVARQAARPCSIRSKSNGPAAPGSSIAGSVGPAGGAPPLPAAIAPAAPAPSAPLAPLAPLAPRLRRSRLLYLQRPIRPHPQRVRQQRSRRRRPSLLCPHRRRSLREHRRHLPATRLTPAPPAPAPTPSPLPPHAAVRPIGAPDPTAHAPRARVHPNTYQSLDSTSTTSLRSLRHRVDAALMMEPNV